MRKSPSGYKIGRFSCMPRTGDGQGAVCFLVVEDDMPRWRTACLATVGTALASAAPAGRPAGGPAARIDGEAETGARRRMELGDRIHQTPELSTGETQPAELVAEQLRSLGLEVGTGVAKTGVI